LNQAIDSEIELYVLVSMGVHQRLVFTPAIMYILACQWNYKAVWISNLRLDSTNSNL